MRVVVVGGGIMGLATAWALARAGHAPVVIDQARLPNPAGGSVDHHRLIRYCYGPEHGYATMVRDAYAAWDRLFADLGERFYRPTGQLLIGPPDDPWITGSTASLAALGIGHEALSGDAAARRFPMLDPDGVAHAVWTDSGGVLLAARIVAATARHLRDRGVELLEEARAVGLDPERALVRLEDGRTIGGDALVVAAGPWVGRLVPALASRILASRQVLAYVEPPAPLAAAWRTGPMITDVLTGEASVFYAVPPVSDTPLKLGDHRFSRAGDPDAPRRAEPAEIDEILALAGRRLRAIRDYAVRDRAVCFYDVAADERFVAERHGPTLVLGGFSGHGFKFGAVIGERAAAVVAGDAPFAPFARWIAGTL